MPLPGVTQVFADYTPWLEPNFTSDTVLTWRAPHGKKGGPLPGVQIGQGNLDVQHYRLARAELRLPQHVTKGATQPKLELVLTHEWINATAAAESIRKVGKHWLTEHPDLVEGPEKEAFLRNRTDILRHEKDAVARQRMWNRSVAGDQLIAAQTQLDMTLESVKAARAKNEVGLRSSLRQARSEVQRSIEQLRLAAKQTKTLSGMSSLSLERAALQAAAQNLTNATTVWSDTWRLSASPEQLRTWSSFALSASPAAHLVSSILSLQETIVSDLVSMESLQAKEAEWEAGATDIMSRASATISDDAHRDYEQMLKQAKRDAVAKLQAKQGKLSSNATTLLAHLDRLHVADSPRVIQAWRCLRQYPMPRHGCFPSSPGSARRLPSLEADMFTEAWAVALGDNRSLITIFVPLVPSNVTKMPALLCAFNPKGCREHAWGTGPLWKREGGTARGYPLLPWWECGMPPEQRPALRIILEPFDVSDEWLGLALKQLRGTDEIVADAGAVEPELAFGPTGVQAVEIHSRHAQSLYMAKSAAKGQQDMARFLTLIALLSVTIIVFFVAAERYTSNGSTFLEFFIKKDLKGGRMGFTADLKTVYLVSGSLLLLTHMTLLVWIPLQGMREARCMDRFDWRKHEWYSVYQWVSRGVEVAIYWRMGGKGYGIMWGLLKLFMGCMGGLDFYTDVTFIVVAYLCQGQATVSGIHLWEASLCTFLVSVMVMQVLVPVGMAMYYPERRLVMIIMIMVMMTIMIIRLLLLLLLLIIIMILLLLLLLLLLLIIMMITTTHQY